MKKQIEIDLIGLVHLEIPRSYLNNVQEVLKEWTTDMLRSLNRKTETRRDGELLHDITHVTAYIEARLAETAPTYRAAANAMSKRLKSNREKFKDEDDECGEKPK